MTSQNPVTLNGLRGGIDRRKVKGGADPGKLYNLVNGYIDEIGRIVSRDGTIEDATLPAGWSKGLLAFDDQLVVFATEAPDVGMPDGYAYEIVQHPTLPTLSIADVHFAEAFMGVIYCTVEFANGDVFDYWLRRADSWTADTIYREGQLVEPTTPNGLVYRARRTGTPAPVWQPNVARTVGDVIEPTVANGYRYECTDTLGATPRSGATEPTWPAEDGAIVNEDTDVTLPSAPTPGGLGDGLDTQLPGEIEDRYTNIGGGGSLSDFLGDLDSA